LGFFLAPVRIPREGGDPDPVAVYDRTQTVLIL
ncbi:MAG: hypothetical protein RJA87_413, partial [Pseudomonadota bacterium]